MKKIIFISSSVLNPGLIKRINEFKKNGYDVAVYAFTRSHSDSIDIENLNIIGHFTNDKTYLKRILLIYKAINNVINKHKDEEAVYYYFGLDIALISVIQNNKKYFYEESDLTYTYINSKFVRYILKKLDKYIIKYSIETIFTSEGFSIFHFGENKPENIFIIPNRLNSSILEINENYSKKLDINKLKIGFVGSARFESIYNFISVFINNFKQHEFHFYGNPISNIDKFKSLDKYSNVFFHGPFKNPNDLFKIYSNIDLVLASYDVKYANVKYAEPNKIYEAIFFNTPIIVTRGTFLAKKVEKLGVGYVINPLEESEIINLINNLSINNINEKINNCKNIPKSFNIDSNDMFFKKINSKF